MARRVQVGSLYYVLGAQASSSRVKQLQQMLQMRRQQEARREAKQGAAEVPTVPMDHSVAERLEL